MSNLHWSRSDKPQKSIVIHFKSQRKVVSADNPRFEEVLDKLRNKAPDEEILELVDRALSVNKHCKGFFTVKNGRVYIGDEEVPDALSRKIIQFHDEKFPVDALVSFWENLSKNPSYNSRQQLFRFLDANQVPIVENGTVLTFKDKHGNPKQVDCSGFFVSWKGVAEDFKDKYSRTFDNTPGLIVEMERRNVNDDPNVTCSSGLHVAAWDYVSNVYGGAKYVKVFVNPADVVSVPTDYKDQKMRTCRYYVVEEVDKPETVSVEESRLLHSDHVRDNLNADLHDDEDDDYDDEHEDDWVDDLDSEDDDWDDDSDY